jgi:hypothetical protein
MPIPPDPRPQRPGIIQYGEASSGNVVVFTGNGGIEDSGVRPVSGGTALGVNSLAVTSGGTFGTTLSAGGAISAGGNVVAGGYVDESVGNALTAVGTTRADALALTKNINNVTAAGAGTGVVLPAVSAAGVGAAVVVFNAGANAMQVYGAGSDTIDGVAGSTGVPLTNAKRAIFYAVAANTWISAQLGVVSA